MCVCVCIERRKSFAFLPNFCIFRSKSFVVFLQHAQNAIVAVAVVVVVLVIFVVKTLGIYFNAQTKWQEKFTCPTPVQ